MCQISKKVIPILAYVITVGQIVSLFCADLGNLVSCLPSLARDIASILILPMANELFGHIYQAIGGLDGDMFSPLCLNLYK